MMQYARDVEAFKYRNGNYIYAIKICPVDRLRLIKANYSDVHLNDLLVPTGLFKHLGSSLYPEPFGKKARTRVRVKSPIGFNNIRNFIWSDWKKYMALIRQLSEENFKLIFIEQGEDLSSERPSIICTDEQQLRKHLVKRKLNPNHYVYAVQALARQASEDGALNYLTERTKTMIEESLPALEKLEEILSAILKLEGEDIEARSQAIVNAEIEEYRKEYDAKLKDAEERHTQQLIEMHETIKNLQEMVDKSYQQNELLLEAQKQQSGNYENQLLGLLEKLKMSHDDLGQKLELLKAQTRSKNELLAKRHEDRKQELILQNQLKPTPSNGDPEIIKLHHELDVEKRQRDRDDALFYGNIDLQDFIKRQQVTQSHLLEEIQHTTVSTILEKAILMIIGAKLERKGGNDKHEQKMTEMTHDTSQQMRLEKFRSELTLQFGEAKAEEVLSILERNIDDWEK